MSTSPARARTSHGDGRWTTAAFARFGAGSFVEATALVFRPEHISLGDGVYLAHHVIAKAYPDGALEIGDGTWVGEQTYLNSAGGLRIGRNVGIGIGVRVITSSHTEQGRDVPILHSALRYAAVEIGDDSDLGVSSTILPGVRIGRGVQVAAGAVVAHDLPDHCVAAGVPARVLRTRP
ncbi:acyltransferase [Phycicoccus duodecadis]|uniref:Acetyltransferase-like isoleucine patch superfamily enzyme n=1 Tax=Phycicoccus duodecadis TaxID=173053 RepID=A0A2N3YEM2_9MICO|nr:acyltransferase [Phycicoccus duodecadis]PKW25280.1 acetyltransferase-like isoleucine patch superfamily enzyme [Phycicoccus duodecadis]